MKTITSGLILVLLIPVLSHAASAEGKVRSAILAYETALVAGDVDGVMDVYGDSPVFMPQHAPAQTGRDSVRTAYENVFATIKLDIKFTIDEIEVLGDTAWARTSSAGETTILENGAVVAEGNNELFVFKKQGRSWKIHRYLFSTNQPRQ